MLSLKFYLNLKKNFWSSYVKISKGPFFSQVATVDMESTQLVLSQFKTF